MSERGRRIGRNCENKNMTVEDKRRKLETDWRTHAYTHTNTHPEREKAYVEGRRSK